MNNGASGYLVAPGQVEAAAVEVDRVNEVLLAPKTLRRVLHPLNLGVNRFAGRVGNAVMMFSNRRLSVLRTRGKGSRWACYPLTKPESPPFIPSNCYGLACSQILTMWSPRSRGGLSSPV